MSVTTPSGTGALGNAYTYYNIPTITSVSPSGGPIAGGTLITLTGTNLIGETAVTLGGITLTGITVVDDTTITGTTPSNTAGSYDLAVTTPGGTGTLTNGFTYYNIPTLTAINPISGPLTGNQTITLTGTNLTGTTGITLGGVAATNITVVNNTTVTAKTPAGTAGLVDVVLSTPGGSASLTNAYTYQTAPTVTAIAPNAGVLAGGTSVVITGTNFTGALGVSFGSNFSSSFTVDSPTQITAIAPAGSEGTINVRVTTPVGSSVIVPAAQYTYEEAPTVTGVSPTAGLPAGGTTVVITGDNFIDATNVYFGGTPASSFVVNTTNQITAVSPVGVQGTAVDITVTTPVGTSTTSSADQYVYEGLPTLSAMSVHAGLPEGGTTVVITGTNFTNTLGVSFGANFASSFTVDSPTQITVTSPAGDPGSIFVRVTTPVGTTGVVLAGAFTYEEVPTVSYIFPNAGVPAGGTPVTITGTNFVAATAVKFGSKSATSYIVNSPTQITAIAPSGTQGSFVDVTVTTPVATSVTSSADVYAYEGPPTLTAISPNSGVLEGGTTVVITGTNFTDTMGVTFGAAFAPTFTVDSPTQITAISPPGDYGTINVRVTTPVGTSSIVTAGEYTFEEAPTVTGVSPNAGLPAGGASVVITGTNFTNATSVLFGSTPATSYTVNGPTQITAVAPAGTQGNLVDITVTTPVATSTTSSADQFVFEGLPTVTGLSVYAGLPSGGTTLVITGTNFTHALGVSFFSTSTTALTVDSPTQITLLTPASPPGTFNVKVTTGVGTSATAPGMQFTFEDVPTVTGVSPSAGHAAGGTSVVISGTNFTRATAVHFGADPATSFVVNSASQITAISPGGTENDVVDITVTTPVGTSATSSADEFLYEEYPFITGISPDAGVPEGGTSVVITGDNFLYTSAVMFGSTPATSYTVDSNTQITAVSPAGTGTVHITVTTPVGTSAIVNADQFTYEGTPTVTGISLGAGPTTGGTTVVLTGTNFIGATGVSFGSNAASSFTVDSETQITAVSPAGSGTVNITVTTPVGTSPTSSADLFIYQSVPTITSISPAAGTPTGGTTVTINGTGFLGTSAVAFGATPATSFTVVSATKITAVSPAGTLGSIVDVTVTTLSGTSNTSAADQFAYETLPTITSIVPSAGLPAGGGTVVITGTNFTAALGVSFGAFFSSSMTVDSPTQITAVVPPGAAGNVYARVSTPLGTSVNTIASEYTYQEAPTVTQVFPNAGLPAGGNVVQIAGTNFADTTDVKFGTVSATSITVNSSTLLTVTAPSGVQGSIVDITVTTPSGTSTTSSADQYAYEGVPTITHISPNAGLPEGGTTVVITGTNFTDTLEVNFGTTFAVTYTVDSPTQVTVIAPEGAPGTTNIRVTTPVGTSSIVPAARYTYEETPTITQVFPNAGFPAGGTTLKIAGTNLTNTTAVYFGATPAVSFVVNSPDLITVVSPPGVQGSIVDITITTPVGTTPITSLDQYAYEGVPTITAISPNSGIPEGGTTVIITGTNFTNNLEVTFGSTFSPSFTVDSPTQVTAIAPAGSPGTTNVRVTTPVGTSAVVPQGQYTYQDAPVVTEIFPNAGLPAGGTTVQIAGSNFIDTTNVYFGSTPASSFTVNSSDLITAISPVGVQGSIVDVTVETPVGTSPTSSVDLYAYEGYPVITGISPIAGAPAGGNSVVITGTNFTNDLQVTFGTNFSPSFTVDSPTQITAIVPAGSPGMTNVRVTTPVGTSGIIHYTYDGVPTIATLNPVAGSVSGGTSVVITGTGYLTVTGVQFDGIDATSFTINSETQITAVTPAHAAGAVTVSLTNSTGTGNKSSGFTYDAAPTISSLSPASGPATGGGSLTINGSGFLTQTEIYIGSVQVTPTSVTDSAIVVDNIPGGTGTVYITVVNPEGVTPISNAAKYSYVPVVTAISPNAGSGTGGTSVTITGAGLDNALAVNFGAGNPGTVTANTGTSITVTSPAGVNTVDITVRTIGGTSAIVPADQYTYFPVVTSLGTTAGITAGGTVVEILGTGFTSATEVVFGSTVLNSFVINSDTSISAVTPAHVAAIVDVTVSNAAGSGTLSDAYTYDDTPTVTALSPDAGAITGGTSVTLTGSGFLSATSVKFGTLPATSFVVNSDTSITAIAPSTTSLRFGGSTVVGVSVTNPIGTSTPTSGSNYTYNSAPTVVLLDPIVGSSGGATPVTIVGTGFSSATSVTFGEIEATSFTIISDTEINAIAPAHAAGPVEVVVVNDAGSATYDYYTYDTTPSITGVSPNVGPATGGNQVIITGTSFLEETAVYFGDALATVTSFTDTEIVIESAPAGTGTVDITVVTLEGTSAITPADQYTYYELPVISSVTPAHGPAAGGTTVTLTGEHFTGVTAVHFGTTDAASFTWVDDTTLTAVSPAGAGPVDITVTTPGGTSTISSSDLFTYDAPQITLLMPNSGSPSGGNQVIIYGVNFNEATAVHWGQIPVSFTYISDSEITVIAPPGKGKMRVKVTTPGGTSGVENGIQVETGEDMYYYIPTVTSISPDYGSTSGGETVTLMGTGFTAGSVVNIGGYDATVTSVSSDGTTIVATTPADPVPGQVGVSVTTTGGTGKLISPTVPSCPGRKR